jgi:hypothetical protein
MEYTSMLAQVLPIMGRTSEGAARLNAERWAIANNIKVEDTFNAT